MKRPDHSLAYVASLQDYGIAHARSIRRKSIVNNASGGHYSRETTETTESYVPENTIISDSSILSEISVRALKLIARIIKELQFNNALWYFDHTKNRRDAKIITELRQRGILRHTEDTRIHYVNPFLLRKGNILAVTANTADLTKARKVERSMIRSLNKKDVKINPMHLIELTN